MRERVIEKAIELIEQGIIQDFSVTKVAKALGASQGNVTYHFPKREELIDAVVERLLSRYMNAAVFDKNKGNKGEVTGDFIRHILKDVQDKAVINTMVFLWLQAQANEDIAQRVRTTFSSLVRMLIMLRKTRRCCLNRLNFCVSH